MLGRPLVFSSGLLNLYGCISNTLWQVSFMSGSDLGGVIRYVEDN